MKRLCVLITNNTLGVRAGSELYVYDLARALLARGHRPVAYSNRLGEVAQGLREAGVPVVDRLDALGVEPDVIHGHHHLEVITALLRFPQTPAVHFCHGRVWEETPLRFPRIRRYVAVSEATRDRLVGELGIGDDRIALIPNFVDLARFAPRPALPEQPRRALIFNHYASEQTFVPPIREACHRTGLTLDVWGLGVGNPQSRPWEGLRTYDLVFASARCAIEALAVGAAVVVCSSYGLGPMVTSAELERLRAANFGRLSGVVDPFGVEDVLRQIRRYDAGDATEVARRMRATAGLEAAVDRLLALYAEVIAEHQQAPPPAAAEAAAVASYLAQISDRIKAAAALHDELAQAQAARAWLAAELGAARAHGTAVSARLHEGEVRLAELAALDVERRQEVAELRTLAGERATLASAQASLRDEVARLQSVERAHRTLVDEHERLQAESRWMRNTRTWRYRQRLVDVPAVRWFYRATRRTLFGSPGS